MTRRFVLELEDTPGWGPATAERRLARALKALLRSYGFRCIRAEPDPADEADRPAPTIHSI